MGQRYTLMLAAKEGRESDLRWVLFDKKTNPNLRDKESGKRPLHFACANGHAGSAHLLLKAGAKPDCRTQDGMTPLHLATYAGHVKCVTALLDYKADVNAKSRFGSTALHQAAYFGRYKCAMVLLERGANVNVQESWGLTPLMLACQKDDSNMVKLLLSFGASLNLADKVDAKSALHYACEFDAADSALAILDAGANPNIPDSSGRTALHTAVTAESPDRLCVILLEYGADSYIEDENQTTVLDLLDSPCVCKSLSPSSRKNLRQRAENYCDGPRSLLSLSRSAVRRAMGPQRTEQVNQLPLPTALQKYVAEIK